MRTTFDIDESLLPFLQEKGKTLKVLKQKGIIEALLSLYKNNDVSDKDVQKAYYDLQISLLENKRKEL